MSAAFASIYSTSPILVEDNFYEWKRTMKMCFLGAASVPTSLARLWLSQEPKLFLASASQAAQYWLVHSGLAWKLA
jgi:hypothetical protein